MQGNEPLKRNAVTEVKEQEDDAIAEEETYQQNQGEPNDGFEIIENSDRIVERAMEDSDEASDEVPDEMDDVEDQGRVSIGRPHTPS